MPYEVRDLIKNHAELVTVTPDQSVQTALEKMIAHDYSQLPIVAASDPHKAVGMITSDSIARALLSLNMTPPQLRVSDAPTDLPRNFKIDSDVFSLLNDLGTVGAVLIDDERDQLVGIVTSYDTTEYFRSQSEDIMFLRDIETYLKEFIEYAFLADGSIDQTRLTAAITAITPSDKRNDAGTTDLRSQFAQAIQRYAELRRADEFISDADVLEQAFTEHFESAGHGTPKGFDRLTLNEYIELFLHKDRWPHYQPIFSVKSKALRPLLEGVRDTRNDLVHFRIDKATPLQHNQIRYCREFLGRYQSSVADAFAPPLPEVADYPPPESDLEREDAPDAGSLSETVNEAENRYAGLTSFLSRQAAAQDRISLTFAELEEQTGSALPTPARQFRAWWDNELINQLQSRSWLDVGWRVLTANVPAQTVTFIRNRELETSYNNFFTALYSDLRSSPLPPPLQLKAGGSSWYNALAAPDHSPFVVFWSVSFFANKECRVSVFIDSRDAPRNKQVYDMLHADRAGIEAEMETELQWLRNDEGRPSRIMVVRPEGVSGASEAQAALRQWVVATLTRLYKVTADRARTAIAATGPGDTL